MSEVYSAILTATVLPEGCTDPISWTSSDNTVATVTPIPNTNTATVTALKAGTCNITVTCGDYSDVCAVTVSAGGPTPITELDLGDTYYINTGYTPTANTKVVSLLSTHKGNSWSTPFGSSDFFKCIWTNSANQIRFEYKGKYGLLKDIPTTLTDVTITCDGKGHTFSIDDTSIGVATTGTSTPTGPILIGTGFSAAGAIEIPPTGTYTKIKTFKIYEDDVLVMNFTPVTSDGVEGLYDSISGRFYGRLNVNDAPVGTLQFSGQYSKLLLKDISSNTLSVPVYITPASALDHIKTSDVAVSDSSIIQASSVYKGTGGWGSYIIAPQSKAGTATFSVTCDGVTDIDTHTVEIVDRNSYNELELVRFYKYQGLSAGYTVNHKINPISSLGYTASVYKVNPNTTYRLIGTRTEGSVYVAVHAVGSFDYSQWEFGHTLIGDEALYGTTTETSIDTTFTTPTGTEFLFIQWTANNSFILTADEPVHLDELDLGNSFYVNTGYIPNANTKVEVKATTTFGPWATVVGSNSFLKILWKNSGGTMAAELGGQVANLSGLGTKVTDGVFTADYSTGKLTVNGSASAAVTPTITSTTYPLLVGTGYSSTGAIETPPATTELQVKYIKVYESGTLVMDLLPSEIEGVQGLYDSIGKHFYGKLDVGDA